jgi:hypothetical protein
MPIIKVIHIDKLTQDDMWAIQYLYGRPERLKYELIPTTVKISTNKQVITEQPNSAHPHEPKANSTKFLEPNLPDLCSINHPDNLLLTSNHHLYIEVFQKWRTNYLLPYRGCLNVHEKNMENMFPTKKKQLFLLLLLTIIQCKQIYIHTSLPCNVTVEDLK